MKSRVAIPAALITLIALVLLPVYNSQNFAEDRNESVRGEMRAICQVAGEMTKDADFEKRQEVISSLNLQADISYGLYSSDGTPLCISEHSENMLHEVDVESATTEVVRSYKQVNAEGVPTIYAIYRFEDGAFLLLSAQEINAASVLATFSPADSASAQIAAPVRPSAVEYFSAFSALTTRTCLFSM